MAFATVGTRGIQAQSVDLSSKVTGTLPVPNGGIGIASGTTDQFLKFTGTETLASAADNAGSLVQTVHYAWNSGDTNATIQNCFNATYRNYFIVFTRFQMGSNDNGLRFKPVNSSGSSESANTYSVRSYYYNGSSNTTQDWTGSNDSSISIMKNQSSGAGKFISGHMYFFDPMNTTDGIKGYTWMARARKEGGYTGYVVGGGGNATTTAYTGINISASSGTLTNGLFTVYGIVNGS